jgi:hypothetical protein
MSILYSHAPEVAPGPHSGEPESAVDALGLFTTIYPEDVTEVNGRIALRTKDGLTRPPVGIIIHDERQGAEVPFSYVDMNGRRSPLDPNLPPDSRPYVVQSWLEYVKGNQTAAGGEYQDPIASALRLQQEQKVATVSTAPATQLTEDKLGNYHGRHVMRESNFIRRIGRRIGAFFVRPMLTQEEPAEQPSQPYDYYGEPALVATAQTSPAPANPSKVAARTASTDLVLASHERLQEEPDAEAFRLITQGLAEAGFPNMDALRQAVRNATPGELGKYEWLLAGIVKKYGRAWRLAGEQGDTAADRRFLALNTGIQNLQKELGLGIRESFDEQDRKRTAGSAITNPADLAAVLQSNRRR